jgi:hypothetical protein
VRSRALLMSFFMLSAVLALGSYAVAGYLSLQSLSLYLLALPAMLLGDRLGFWAFSRFGGTLYRRVALLVLYSVGVAITLRALTT